MPAKLSQLLVREGIASRRLVEEALRIQARDGGGLDTCILEVGACPCDALERAMVRTWEQPNRVDPRIDVPDSAALALLSAFEAAHFGVVPFYIIADRVEVVTTVPITAGLRERLQLKIGLEPDFSVTPEVVLWQLLKRYYGLRPPERVAKLLSSNKEAAVRWREDFAPDQHRAVAPEIAADAIPVVELCPPPRASDSLAPASAGASEPEPGPASALVQAVLPGLAESPADSPARREFLARLRSLRGRDQLPPAVFSYVAPYVRRAVLLTVRRGLCRGWLAHGPSLPPSSVHGLLFSLERASVFAEAVANGLFLGRMKHSRIHRLFCERLGAPTVTRVVAAASALGARPVALLIADCPDQDAQRRALPIVADAANAMSYAIAALILSHKQKRQPSGSLL